ncbi:MAG: NAD(P)-dependent oxidoreductase [Spirulina sp. SIO3F2]|nr:NAD(P)-dependent oxidoreductase [Spirulina sp. SIO3F2]
MTPRPRLLITGASGFLGWNLAQAAQADWTVLGTYYRHPVKIPSVELHRLDCTEPGAIARCLNQFQPDAVIHTAALSQPNACAQNLALSYQLNVNVPLDWALGCAERQIPLVWTSTEAVFDGLNPPYTEDSPPCPVNIYGEHKAQAEQLILAQAPNTAICRMPLMFGDAIPPAQSFVQPFLRSLRAGQSIQLFTDEYRMPISATTAAHGLLLALRQGVKGLLHLSGSERISRYDFGCQMAQVWSLPEDLLQGCRQADVPMAAQRPRDLQLSNARAIALGYQPQIVREELMALRDRL